MPTVVKHTLVHVLSCLSLRINGRFAIMANYIPPSDIDPRQPKGNPPEHLCPHIYKAQPKRRHPPAKSTGVLRRVAGPVLLPTTKAAPGKSWDNSASVPEHQSPSISIKAEAPDIKAEDPEINAPSAKKLRRSETAAPIAASRASSTSDPPTPSTGDLASESQEQMFCRAFWAGMASARKS